MEGEPNCIYYRRAYLERKKSSQYIYAIIGLG
jgi:hypothetical protein